jgi:hypothetical protein
MPKYDIELTLYRTVEADNIDEAERVADYEKSRLVDGGLAGDLGWHSVATRISRRQKRGN